MLCLSFGIASLEQKALEKEVKKKQNESTNQMETRGLKDPLKHAGRTGR